MRYVVSNTYGEAKAFAEAQGWSLYDWQRRTTQRLTLCACLDPKKDSIYVVAGTCFGPADGTGQNGHTRLARLARVVPVFEETTCGDGACLVRRVES